MGDGKQPRPITFPYLLMLKTNSNSHWLLPIKTQPITMQDDSFFFPSFNLILYEVLALGSELPFDFPDFFLPSYFYVTSIVVNVFLFSSSLSLLAPTWKWGQGGRRARRRKEGRKEGRRRCGLERRANGRRMREGCERRYRKGGEEERRRGMGKLKQGEGE